MKYIIVLLFMSVFVPSAQAIICGPNNKGVLPNNGYRFCKDSINQRYDYCGNKIGTLRGLNTHPLFCETTWSNLNLDTVKVCAGNVVIQSATRGPTTRTREVYSLNEGWIWSPDVASKCAPTSFQQKSNCGAKRPATGTKQCCTPTAWSTTSAKVCNGLRVTVTNGCETKIVEGTKNCGTSGEPAGGGRVTGKHEDTIWTTTSFGDEGFFQANGTSTNETILYNENRNTIIRRFQSAAGHPYRMWIDDNEPGGFGVNLKDRPSFDNWLEYMEQVDPSTGGEYHPRKHWCEMIESIWTPWVNDSTPPTTCGTHTYTRSRQCNTVQGAAKPCPSLCPNGSTSQNEAESVTIDNGACGRPPTTPSPVTPICTDPFAYMDSSYCATKISEKVRCVLIYGL